MAPLRVTLLLLLRRVSRLGIALLRAITALLLLLGVGTLRRVRLLVSGVPLLWRRGLLLVATRVSLGLLLVTAGIALLRLRGRGIATLLLVRRLLRVAAVLLLW